jgi:CubicO group peptidase (beta-lactamase class C family)
MKVFRKMLRKMASALCSLLALAMLLTPGKARADWLQDLETDVVNWMTAAAIPGMSIAIVQGGVVIYAKGFGHLSIDPSSPLVDANTVFGIGSCSKAFAAVQLAMLEDQKVLSWQDKVKDHLPGFQMYDPWVNGQFQVEDLLCHRSGLPWYSMFSTMILGYSPDSQVRAIGFKHPGTSFRASFAYQNSMYVAASKLIEAKTGQTWSENLSEKIFTPLGMTRSVTTEAEKNNLGNVALGHLLMPDGSLWPAPPNWSNTFFDDNALGAGAIRSSALDMAQWMLLNLALGKWEDQQIVSPDNMRYLQAPRVLQAASASGPGSTNCGPVSYCAGWQYFGLAPQPLITHDGTTTGYKSSVLLVPGADIGIVILSNIGADFTGTPSLAARAGVVQKIAFRFYDLYFGRATSSTELEQYVANLQALSGANPAPTPLSMNAPSVCLPLKNYTGVYYHPAYGKFVVTKSGGGLMITMGPRKIQAKLVPKDGTFLAYLPDYPANYPMYIPFTFKFSGAGATMTMGKVLGWDQNDVFTRISN